MSNFTQALKELTGFENDAPAENVKIHAGNAKSESYETPNKTGRTFGREFEFNDPIVDIVEDEADAADEELFFEPSDTATDISSTMIVSGDIKTSDDIIIEGFVIGNIYSTGNIRTCGKQIGDMKAVNAIIMDAKQKGNINVSDKVSIGRGSIVQGDVKCGDIDIDSKIKGNIDARGKAAILPEAQIVGNVAADTVKTYPGAKINGTIIVGSAIDDFDIELDLEIGGDI